MKRCPKCNIEYFDNMLIFCLEDGERLISGSFSTRDNPEENAPPQIKTVALKNPSNPSPSEPSESGKIKNKKAVEIKNKTERIKKSLTEKWLKTLEVVPVILALAHNYWQWLYLERKSFYDFSSFFLSAVFIVWLILFISGAVFGILSLKYSRTKGFAITALVVLAINVILSIVPK